MNKKEKLVLIALACVFILGVVFSIRDLNIPVMSSQAQQEYEKQTKTLKTGPIDINSANTMELQLLTGIGPAKADAIVAYRTMTGMFTKKEDIMNVTGIGPATYEKIKDRLEITQSSSSDRQSVDIEGSSERLNINNASQQQLETLPGIGPVKAKSIIDHRESNGDFQDLSDLLLVKGIGEKTLETMKPMITTEK